ncbi:ArsR/SmtB family transcription factor [Acetobacterium sp.]|uniref:ArsR/SmtB family transcription factor n=1 Tax=Acetobacterium sp. TaxID=1872094 RepID=UPI003593AE49
MDKVLKNEYTEETLFEVAEFFKVLGDPTRIKIVSALFENGELCVNDIVELMDVSRTAVSHQLRILKDKRIVSYRKEGQMKIYHLDDAHVEVIVLLTITHLKHH